MSLNGSLKQKGRKNVDKKNVRERFFGTFILLIVCIAICAIVWGIVAAVKKCGELNEKANSKAIKKFPAVTAVIYVNIKSGINKYYEIRYVTSDSKILTANIPARIEDRENFLYVSSCQFFEDAPPGQMYITYTLDKSNDVVANIHVRREYQTADCWIFKSIPN